MPPRAGPGLCARRGALQAGGAAPGRAGFTLRRLRAGLRGCGAGWARGAPLDSGREASGDDALRPRGAGASPGPCGPGLRPGVLGEGTLLALEGTWEDCAVCFL